MKLRQLPILETRKVYVDNLAEWIEVPVFNQEQVIRLVNDIDWDGLNMWQYKQNLINHWHKLPPQIKARIKEPAVRDELYEILIHENWGLAPGKALSAPFVYTEAEYESIQTWFASRGAKGKPPVVLDGVSK